MIKEMINDIEIRYDESQISDIKNIKKTIENNYNLFLIVMESFRAISFIPTDEDNVIYISDFDVAFYNVVNNVYNTEDDKKLLENPNMIAALNLECLVRKNASYRDTVVMPHSDVDDEMFYSLIAYIYFMKNGSFDDFVNYLKDKKDLDKILEWLQNTYRVQTYNFVLRELVGQLKENGFEFFENIGHVVNEILYLSINEANFDEDEVKLKIPELPLFTIDKLDGMFIDFLKSINAPDNWFLMYEELKNKNLIEFKKHDGDFNSSKCYEDNDNKLRILIDCDGTVYDFCNFVHEFIHYVTMHNKSRMPQLSISEIPSIFFEKLVSIYLKTKGYSDDVVFAIKQKRKQNNIDINLMLAPLFRDIHIFNTKGEILKSDKVQFWENLFKSIYDTKQTIAKKLIDEGEIVEDDSFLNKKIDIDIERCIDDEYDSLINSFITSGFMVVKGYQYLLGTFIADQLLEKALCDKNVISKMIDLADELYNMSLSDILSLFDMQDIFDDNKTSDKIKTKKI